MPKYFPIVSTRKIIEYIGDGDNDVTAVDTTVIADALVFGEDGQVAVNDTIDVGDKLVVTEYVLVDSVDVGDKFVVTEYVLSDSMNLNDLLVFGTDGQVSINDTVNVEDKLVVTEFMFADNIDSNSVVIDTNLNVVCDDSIDVLNRVNIVELDYLPDSIGIDDIIKVDGLIVQESITNSDAVDQMILDNLLDSIDIASISNANVSPQALDSVGLNDTFHSLDSIFNDSGNIEDLKQTSTFTGDAFCDSLVSNSNFTDPANAYDTSTTTGAILSVTQSGGVLSGSSADLTGTIVVALPNSTFSPNETYSGQATFLWGWDTSATAALQTGNSVNMTIDYSLNNGTDWTLLESVTTVGDSGDNTTSVTVDATNFNSIQFRATGTVTSGEIAVTGGASQSFTFRYGRVQFAGSQA